MHAKVFNDQLASGIIEEVSEDLLSQDRCYYLLHQAVIENSATSPIRVVFNASSHCEGAPSLNACIYQSPTILPNLVRILMRMRTFRLVLIYDVEKSSIKCASMKNSATSLVSFG